jgi:DUF971 family protein
MENRMNHEIDTPVPTGLDRLGTGGLRITWSDGQRRVYRVAELRQACPCASCREKRAAASDAADRPRGLPVLKAAEAKPLEVIAMGPVGNYAYHVAFSDNHDSGLFTFPLLRSLGQVES